MLAFSPPRLRGFRHMHKATFEQIANACGIAALDVERIESGVMPPSSDLIARLAAFFGYPPTELMADGDPMDNIHFWEAACQVLPPLSDRAVIAVAAIFDRIDARIARAIENGIDIDADTGH